MAVLKVNFKKEKVTAKNSTVDRNKIVFTGATPEQCLLIGITCICSPSPLWEWLRVAQKKILKVLFMYKS